MRDREREKERRARRGGNKTHPRSIKVRTALSITSRRRDTRLDGRSGFCPSREGRQTRYLRLIGNGTSFVRDIISSRKITISLAAATLAGGTRKKRHRLGARRVAGAPDKTSGILTSTGVFVAPRYRAPSLLSQSDAASPETTSRRPADPGTIIDAVQAGRSLLVPVVG